jgi:hypothetical protein
MNLHGIVSGYISAINPQQVVAVQLSIGSTTDASGNRTPAYTDPIYVEAQLQDLSQKDIEHLEGLNIQKSQRVAYLNGAMDAINRISRKGGDLLTEQDGTIWLVTAILEQWPDFVKISLTQQMTGA